MPIYEYKCAACGHGDEHLQKVSEKPLTKCPSCGKKKYQKQLSAAGFQLKGSGWYATDFKGGKTEKKTEVKADAKAEGKAEAKAETKSETKTEKKADKKEPASSTN